MNNAPFIVGQRVVCVREQRDYGLLKGYVYQISGIKKRSCNCNQLGWEVTLHELEHVADITVCVCGTIESGALFYADRFAPIAPRSIEIPESLKEQAEEMKDLAETIAPIKKELV